MWEGTPAAPHSTACIKTIKIYNVHADGRFVWRRQAQAPSNTSTAEGWYRPHPQAPSTAKGRYRPHPLPKGGTGPVHCQRAVQAPSTAKGWYRPRPLPKSGTGPIHCKRVVQAPSTAKGWYRPRPLQKGGTGPLHRKRVVQAPSTAKGWHRPHPLPKGGTGPIHCQRVVQPPSARTTQRSHPRSTVGVTAVLDAAKQGVSERAKQGASEWDPWPHCHHWGGAILCATAFLAHSHRVPHSVDDLRLAVGICVEAERPEVPPAWHGVGHGAGHQVLVVRLPSDARYVRKEAELVPAVVRVRVCGVRKRGGVSNHSGDEPDNQRMRPGPSHATK
jgi:hypothetical protein